jgi:hypothetical protein
MSMKNSSDTIGNRTRDVPVCSAVPQPTAPVIKHESKVQLKNAENYLIFGSKIQENLGVNFSPFAYPERSVSRIIA